MRVLIIEDEKKISGFIKKGLEEQMFTVDVALDGEAGIRRLQQKEYDIVILDVVLPGMNGFEVCKQIRRIKPGIPVLMLTALGTLDDKVTGLDSGADDYLTKPFHFQELLARMRALARRNIPEKTFDQIIKVADLEINIDSKQVKRGGKEHILTAREFRLLVLLARNKGRVLSRSEIAEKIWEESFESGSNVIDVYVSYLRKKIDRGPGKKLIHTIIGMGYVLRE